MPAYHGLVPKPQHGEDPEEFAKDWKAMIKNAAAEAKGKVTKIKVSNDAFYFTCESTTVAEKIIAELQEVLGVEIALVASAAREFAKKYRLAKVGAEQ